MTPRATPIVGHSKALSLRAAYTGIPSAAAIMLSKFLRECVRPTMTPAPGSSTLNPSKCGHAPFIKAYRVGPCMTSTQVVQETAMTNVALKRKSPIQSSNCTTGAMYKVYSCSMRCNSHCPSRPPSLM